MSEPRKLSERITFAGVPDPRGSGAMVSVHVLVDGRPWSPPGEVLSGLVECDADERSMLVAMLADELLEQGAFGPAPEPPPASAAAPAPGVRFTLERIHQIAQQGRDNPAVRAWVAKQLALAGSPTDPRQSAKALLEAIRREKVWVPDPMPYPHAFVVGDCNPFEPTGNPELDAQIARARSAGVAELLSKVVGPEHIAPPGLYPEAQVLGEAVKLEERPQHIVNAAWTGSEWRRLDPLIDPLVPQAEPANDEAPKQAPPGFVHGTLTYDPDNPIMTAKVDGVPVLQLVARLAEQRGISIEEAATIIGAELAEALKAAADNEKGGKP